MTATRLRVALQCATSLTLAAIACVVGQAGGTWWALVLFATAAVTADAAAHTHERGRQLRTAQQIIVRLTQGQPDTVGWTPAAGLARLRADLAPVPDAYGRPICTSVFGPLCPICLPPAPKETDRA